MKNKIRSLVSNAHGRTEGKLSQSVEFDIQDQVTDRFPLPLVSPDCKGPVVFEPFLLIAQSFGIYGKRYLPAHFSRFWT